MKTHEIKILPEYFAAVNRGDKTAEVRFDDRDYRTGDWLILKEWKPRKKAFTGRELRRKITSMTQLSRVICGECVQRWVVLHLGREA